MHAPPADNVVLDFMVGAFFIGEDAPPGANASAETGGELGTLALLAFLVVNLGCRLAQHLASQDAIKVERLVASAVELAKGLELPGLAGEPCENPAFDHTEVSGDQRVIRR